MNKWGWLSLLLLPVIFVLIGVFILMGMFFIIAGGEDEQPAYIGGPISEIGANQIPAEFLPIYQAAAEEYNIPWNLLAAIHRVETVFSTIDPMVSYAGAEGHFQFMPCTWTGWNHPSCNGLGAGNIGAAEKVNPAVIARYGGYGVDANGDGRADPWDLEDAVFTAASYLARSGAASGDYRKAIFNYNHSEKYVSDVLGFMQQFAEGGSIELTPGTGGFNRPLNTAVTSRFGNRFHPIDKVWHLHGGIDFDCNAGDPIPASKAGVVTYAGWMDAANPKSGYGIYVWVDHGGGYKTTYAHLSRTAVNIGDPVNAGDIVGACGTTGTSTGDHLHFEIFKDGKRTDPAPYLGL